MSNPLYLNPLKDRAQGVKLPQVNPEWNVRNSYKVDPEAHHRRYYPMTKDGQVDEWGAIVKKQADDFEIDQENLRLKKKFEAQQYGQELIRASQDKAHQEVLYQSQKRAERERVLRSIDVSQSIDKSQREQYLMKKENLKEIQKHLVDYNTGKREAMSQDQKQKDKLNVQRDEEAYEKAIYGQRIQNAERKRFHSRDLEQAIHLKNALRDQEKQKQLESDDYACLSSVGTNYAKQLDRQMNVEKFQRGIQNDYQKRVRYPHQQQMTQVQVQEANAEQQANEIRAQNYAFQNQQRVQGHSELQQDLLSQMDLKARQKLIEEEQLTADQKVWQREFEEKNKNIDDYIKNQQIFKKKVYKDLLDKQMEVNSNQRLYGNMTSVEKAMNKYDLEAYKNYDQHQYSLIPGINHKKEHQAPEFKVDHPEYQSLDHKEKLDYYRKVGYNPGIEVRGFGRGLGVASLNGGSPIQYGKFTQLQTIDSKPRELGQRSDLEERHNGISPIPTLDVGRPRRARNNAVLSSMPTPQMKDYIQGYRNMNMQEQSPQNYKYQTNRISQPQIAEQMENPEIVELHSPRQNYHQELMGHPQQNMPPQNYSAPGIRQSVNLQEYSTNPNDHPQEIQMGRYLQNQPTSIQHPINLPDIKLNAHQSRFMTEYNDQYEHPVGQVQKMREQNIPNALLQVGRSIVQ